MTLHYLGKTYGTNPVDLLRMPLGELDMLMLIAEAGMEDEELKRRKAEMKGRSGGY